MKRLTRLSEPASVAGAARRLCELVWRPSVHDEVDEEVAFHIEMRTRDFVAQGMAPAEARAAAVRRFGDVGRVRTSCRAIGARRDREVRLTEWAEGLWQDVRFAVRQLRQAPAFSLVAVLTLALGTGANTTVFSVVHGVLLRSLPYPDEGRLYVLWERSAERDVEKSPLSFANYEDYKAQARSFASMGAAAFRTYDLTRAAQPEQLVAFAVSDGLFATLGVRPLLGRTIGDRESRDADADVAVLSYELWQRQFGGDSGIVGRAITLDGRPFTVVGVLPPKQGWPYFASLWTPLGPGPTSRDARSPGVNVVGRLRAGATAEDAQRELAVIGGRLAAAHPKENGGWGAQLVSLHEETVGAQRPRLLLLLGAVGCVLLAACINLAHMLLARGAQRQREVAVRVAMGATRGRIVRQLVTEGVTLAVVGSAAGVLVARGLLPVLLRLAPGELPRKDEVTLDPAVLAFALAVALATGLLVGVLPAMRASRLDVAQAIKNGVGGAGRGRGWALRGALVVSEVALATVLVVGAGLLLMSFSRLQQVALGFDPRPVVTLGLVLPENVYPAAADAREFFRRARERIGALPQVEAVGASNAPPFGMNMQAEVSPVGVRDARPQQAGSQVITQGYLEALRIALLRGRAFGDEDTPDGPRVALVNETLARRFFPGADPVGRTLRVRESGREPREVTIVGVVGDVRHAGRAQAVVPEVYEPYAQNVWEYMNLVVRTRGADPAGALPSIRRAIAEVDPVRPLFAVQPMAEALERDGAQPRFSAVLVAAFAALAALLACVGVAGLMAFAVATREREIGIRTALGAQTRDILLLVFRPGVGLVGAGVAVGAVAAAALSHLVRGLLYGVRPTDPLVFAAAAAGLALAGVVACYLPTRRAAAIEPAKVLRRE
jgi:putative ABC transport system permease protein